MNIEVWKMVLRFVDFWETHNPTLIEAEVHLFSDELKVAGTCDMVCEFGGERWLMDFKTSNHMQTTYDLQGAVYAKCYEECFGKKLIELEFCGLNHLHEVKIKMARKSREKIGKYTNPKEHKMKI